MTSVLAEGGSITIIPDAIRGKTLSKIKDAQYITMSKQLRGYAERKQPVELIVSPKTQAISKDLRDMIIDSGGSIRVYDPVTKAFTLGKF